MVRKKKTKKLGMTLVEVIAVMAIFALTTTSIFGGIFYLMSSVRADNAIYKLKGEIQAIQNVARTSGLASDANRVNIGWVIELSNSGNDINISRKPIYVNYTTNISNLSGLGNAVNTSLLNIRGSENNSYNFIYCDNNGSLKSRNVGSSAATDAILTGFGDKGCSAPDNTPFDRAEPRIEGMNLRFTATTLNPCTYPNNFGKSTIFFAGATGIPSYNGVQNTQNTWCQIVISPSNDANTLRGIKVNKMSGSVQTCSGVCE